VVVMIHLPACCDISAVCQMAPAVNAAAAGDVTSLWLTVQPISSPVDMQTHDGSAFNNRVTLTFDLI